MLSFLPNLFPFLPPLHRSRSSRSVSQPGDPAPPPPRPPPPKMNVRDDPRIRSFQYSNPGVKVASAIFQTQSDTEIRAPPCTISVFLFKVQNMYVFQAFIHEDLTLACSNNLQVERGVKNIIGIILW